MRAASPSPMPPIPGMGFLHELQAIWATRPDWPTVLLWIEEASCRLGSAEIDSCCWWIDLANPYVVEQDDDEKARTHVA